MQTDESRRASWSRRDMLRGSAAAMQQLSANVFGRAVGLVLIGFVSDQLHSLRLALLVLPASALLAAAISAASGLASMPGDVAAAEKDLCRAASRKYVSCWRVKALPIDAQVNQA